jgi:hypothetical protein
MWTDLVADVAAAMGRGKGLSPALPWMMISLGVQNCLSGLSGIRSGVRSSFFDN